MTTETPAEVIAAMRKESENPGFGDETDRGYNSACRYWADRLERSLAAGRVAYTVSCVHFTTQEGTCFFEVKTADPPENGVVLYTATPADPALRGHEFLKWCAHWFGPDADETHIANAVRELLKLPAEPAKASEPDASLGDYSAAGIDAGYRWERMRNALRQEADRLRLHKPHGQEWRPVVQADIDRMLSVAEVAASPARAPDGWREFVEECAKAAGGEVCGNALSRRAAALLATPPASAPEVTGYQLSLSEANRLIDAHDEWIAEADSIGADWSGNAAKLEKLHALTSALQEKNHD